jgi:hypothetical protein
LHASLSTSGAAHSFPAAVTTRERDRVPPPHPAVHELHGAQSDTAHWSLQAAPWHCTVSDRVGHRRPPLAGAVTTDRVRVTDATPHTEGHAGNADQSLTTQSTGGPVAAPQERALHTSVVTSGPHTRYSALDRLCRVLVLGGGVHEHGAREGGVRKGS